MPDRLRPALAGLSAALVTTLLLSACEQLVYRQRQVFNPPPDTSSGFLGYYDVSTQLTTCGNCHISYQTEWAQTKHAHAYADLVASGHANPSCYGCHTVNERGNALTVAAGYDATPDSAYQDVQCEACHGPGYTHVQGPTRENAPLASIEADTGLTNGCGECHQGKPHNPFVEQWAQSAHASGPGWDHAKANATCQPCHEGRAAIAMTFNDPSNYVEKADSADYQRIVCAVCHNPHGSPYAHQLRASISTPTTANLCVVCHSREGSPRPPTFRGPHAAQGLLVLDQDVGWIPPNFQYDTTTIVGSHGTAANPQLCATCHVAAYDVTDSSGILFHSTGHTFLPIPCVDASGVPLPPDSSCTVDQRDFRACATSGCHGDQTAARSAFLTVKARMEYLTDQLWTDSNNNGTIDPYPTDGGLLPKIVANATTAADSNAINLSDNTLTVAEGAIWNAQLAATHDRPQWLAGTVFGRTFSAHYSSGEGVHNPFLLEALMIASIQAVENTYGVSPSAPIDLSTHMQPPPGLRLTVASRRTGR
jgi:predicted CXXCH cytochrome family protein